VTAGPAPGPAHLQNMTREGLSRDRGVSRVPHMRRTPRSRRLTAIVVSCRSPAAPAGAPAPRGKRCPEPGQRDNRRRPAGPCRASRDYRGQRSKVTSTGVRCRVPHVGEAGGSPAAHRGAPARPRSASTKAPPSPLQVPAVRSAAGRPRRPARPAPATESRSPPAGEPRSRPPPPNRDRPQPANRDHVRRHRTAITTAATVRRTPCYPHLSRPL